MVGIKPPLHSQQGIPRTGQHIRVIAARFRDAQRHLEFELNAMAKSVVEVDVGDFVLAGKRITIPQHSDVDLPISVSRRIRVIGPKWRTALSEHQPSAEHRYYQYEPIGSCKYRYHLTYSLHLASQTL